MIRTRNFLLFILILAFLVGGILLTLWFSADTAVRGSYSDMIFGGANTATMTAEVVTLDDKRESRLAALRKKLSGFTDVALAPSTDEAAIEEELTSTATSTPPATATVKLCSNYRVASVPKLTGGLTYAEAGGQRTFLLTETVLSESTSTPPLTTQTTVFTLPLRTGELGVTDCIGTDVVAVTPTGLPIRNSEVLKYSGSGENTLIGYTIDGLQLFGSTSSINTDECGGATVGGVYRYYLSTERATLINCFVAIPVAL
jgi:hypothetical protein